MAEGGRKHNHNKGSRAGQSVPDCRPASVPDVPPGGWNQINRSGITLWLRSPAQWLHGNWAKGRRAAMGATMWNLNWLSSNWRTQICFALAGLIFVLCQFLVGAPPKLDELPGLQADRSSGDGSFQDLTIYFNSLEQRANGLSQEPED